MIEFDSVSYRVDSVLLLSDISFTLKPKESVCLLGHNGSGKSTLIKHFNRLLKPSLGSVSIDNLQTDRQIRSIVGMVFQNPEDQLVHSIVEEDIAFGLENLDITDWKTRVTEILKQLGILKLAKRNVETLSFGQKQLVALAGVLVMKPKYLILDEPTTMLDPKNKRILFDHLKKLNKEMAILYATNEPNDRKYGKRCLILREGKLIFDGPCTKVNNALLRTADLE